jgi:arylsulfatase A-like enzyme
VGAYQQVLAPGSASLKDTPWEGGHRVFGVVAGPGVPRGSVSHALASTLDVWPTVAALVGAPLPGDRSFDGEDLSPVLFDGAPSVRDVLFIPDTSGATECQLTGARFHNWTVYWQTSGQSSCTRDFSPLPAVVHDPPLAFDLATDPGQTTPVPLPPDVLAAVTAARDAKMADVRATFRTTTDWAGGGRAAWPCCNRNEPDCGCRDAAAAGARLR